MRSESGLKWSEEYATGIERIDHQHKMLFAMSEDFRATLDHGQGERVYGELLTSLKLYARGHFGFEEQCMERYRCPVAQKNCVAHATFLEVLAEFRQHYAGHGFDRSDAQRLVEFIDHWLADHICRIDVQIRPYATPP